MKVRVLGCSGAIGKDCRTTSFLIDHDLLVDAGTGVGDLTLEEMRSIDHVPLQVHALQATIDALKAHIFNNTIWPDFSRIPTPEAPFITFHLLELGQTLGLAHKQIEVLPAVHTVPAAGYAISSGELNSGSAAWVFTGDTEQNPALWARINQLKVAMLVIETAFSNRESDLAKRSLHLSPQALASELDYIAPGSSYPIYITHTKPAETELIMAEIDRFEQARPVSDQVAHDIRWLRAGQEFEI
jgi:cAMP phosphodiesterase